MAPRVGTSYEKTQSSAVRIKLRDLNLDQNGDGVVDENEKKLLHTLQEMDTNQDGEIGLVELCQMGANLEQQKAQTRSLLRILMGVLVVCIIALVVMFVSAYAAVEVSKDFKPSENGTLQTGDGTAVKTQTLKRYVSIGEMARLTTSTLDGFTRLKYTIDGMVHSHVLTGYTASTLSTSQRAVTFYTARNEMVRVSVWNGDGRAEVVHADGTVADITAAKIDAGRRLLSSDNDQDGAITDSDAMAETYIEPTTRCHSRCSNSWKNPFMNNYQLCELFTEEVEAGTHYEVCCYEESYAHMDLAACGGEDSRCRITAAAGSDLGHVYPGLEAPSEGKVAIYTVDSSGSLTYQRTRDTTSDPALCQPLRWGYVCVYGVDEDSPTAPPPPPPSPPPSPLDHGLLDKCSNDVTTAVYSVVSDAIENPENYLIRPRENGNPGAEDGVLAGCPNDQEGCLIGLFSRMGFHSCLGTCNGCIDTDDGFNLGLDWLTGYSGPSKSEPGVYARMRANPEWPAVMSNADMYANVATAALRYAAANADTPFSQGTLPYYCGRVDAETCESSDWDSKNLMHMGIKGLTDFMDEQFGLSASETTALLGVHTLGRGRMANGKFNGKWVPEHTAKNPNSSPINLDNTYFIELVREDYSGGYYWNQVKPSADNCKGFDSEHYSWSTHECTRMMLNIDLALYRNIGELEDGIDLDGKVSCADSFPYFMACDYYTDVNAAGSATAARAYHYAYDNAHWLADFAYAFLKMVITLPGDNSDK